MAARLHAAGVESATWDARVLVDTAFPGNTPVDADGLATLDMLVAKRVTRVPLQLLVGHTGFRMIELICRPGVFIPRPETEILVGVVLDELATLAHPRVIEPCTGTGAIVASLLAERDTVDVFATDVNPDAVRLARDNIARVVSGDAGVPPRPDTAQATVAHGSLYDPVPDRFRGVTDVIVCNPPYLPHDTFADLPREVHDHDPYAALVGGTDGHELVDQLFRQAHMWLRSGGLIALEVDALRLDDACVRAEAAGLVAVDTVRDLTGTYRFVTARCR